MNTTFGPGEDVLQAQAGIFGNWRSKSFSRGNPMVTQKNTGGSAFPTIVYQKTLLGLTNHSHARNPIRTYNDDHSVVHYDAAGVIQHARTPTGDTSHGSFIYHGSANGIDPASLTPIYPYWLIKYNPSTGSGVHHQEHWLNTTSQLSSDEVLSAWHGLDSHGMAFADATHFQFNPAGGLFTGSMQWPDGSSIKTDTGHMYFYDHVGTLIGTWPSTGGGGGGSSAFSFVAKTANYTITTSDSGILADATGGSITITLPTAVGCTQTYTIARADNNFPSTTVTIATTSSQTINGVVGGTLVQLGQSFVLGSDGSNWWVVSAYYPSPLTTLGDTLGTDQYAKPQRQPIGTNGQTLTVDTTQTLDLIWT